MRRLVLLASSLLLPLGLGGCYRYIDTYPEALVPGADVRVRVSRERAMELEDRLDQADTREFDAVFVENPSSNVLRLSVPFQGVEVGSARRGFNEIVDLPILELENVQLRQFDWKRTGGLVGLGAIVTFAVLDAFFDPFDSSEGGDEPGDVDSALIPLLSIRW